MTRGKLATATSPWICHPRIVWHIVIGDHAIVSGFAPAHQFCRHSIADALSKIVQGKTHRMRSVTL